ncbi:MAG: CBS domain-containing protein, partial [Cyanobacteria bacterium J06638_22]
MTRDLLTVRPETPLAEAVQLLAKNRISGLPVVNATGELIGILSEADL